MTRDEAIKQAECAMNLTLAPGERSTDAQRFVDMATSFGLLKLDEGKRADERPLDFGRAILGAISDAGFRIAPK